MALKCKAYLDLSLDVGVHRSRTVTTDTHKFYSYNILRVLGWGLVGTSADTRAQGPICDNQAFQTSAPTWKGGHGKGQRFLFFWSPGLEWEQWTEV